MQTKKFRWLTVAAFSALTALPLTAPSTMPVAFAEAGSQNDTTIKTNLRIPLNNLTTTVNGQSYTANGSIHAVFQAQPSGNGYDVRGQLNAQGISVQGPNGETYRSVGVIQIQGTISGRTGSFTSRVNLGLIGKGDAPNYRVQADVTSSIDANGRITATISNLRVTTR
ncbi:MAG TPA: hypothetical protein VF681_08820 [Abditibacteriaceae bacterium]|jgi:hypothetical protein